MTIYTTVLSALFGRGAAHPYSAALYRLAGTAGAALILGYGAGHNLPPLPILHADTDYLFAVIVFGVQLCMLFGLFASLGILGSYRTSTLMRFMSFLPLARRQMWLISVLPHLVLAFLCLCLLAWPLYRLTYHLLPVALLVIAVVSGALSALGITSLYQYRRRSLAILTTFLMLGSEYKLIQWLAISGPEQLNALYITLFCAANCLLVTSLFAGIGKAWQLSSFVPKNTQVQLSKLPASWWFIKKLLRNSSTKLGFITTVCMSIFLTCIAVYFKLSDPLLLLVLSTLLVGAFTSDIRSLARATQSIEIAGLRGVGYFMRVQAIAAFILGTIAVAPLMIVASFSMTSTAWPSGIDYILLYMLGLVSGLFTGTLFAVRKRDILTQCTTTIVTLTVILVPNLLFKPGSPASISIHSGLVVFLACAAIIIERQRNRYAWRGYDR